MKNIASPLVSVIVPVYNVEKYLEECCDSILNQTYKNLEIILIDDGSDDNSPKICDSYKEKDSRVKVIHQKNSGVSSARNNGIKNSCGDFIIFADSDDKLEKNMCEKAVEALSQNTDAVFFGYKRTDKNMSVVGEHIPVCGGGAHVRYTKTPSLTSSYLHA